MNATTLRKNIYQVLDQVLESGVAQEIDRKGRKLLIIPAEPKRRRFEDAPKRRATTGTFDELVATSWEKSWSPDV